MKTKSTLRTYLFDRRVELYEKVNKLKDLKLNMMSTSDDERLLECTEAELDVVKAVIEICQSRGKY